MASQVVGVPERSFGGYLSRAGKEICLDFYSLPTSIGGKKERGWFVSMTVQMFNYSWGDWIKPLSGFSEF
jgi:hypothetical protein